MVDVSIQGRTWRFRNSLGRDSGEQNGTAGGFCSPMDVAVDSDGVLFVLSRGFGYETPGRGADVGRRIGKTTIDENHIGDFARKEFTWPVGIAIASDGNIYCSDEYENKILFFKPDRMIPFPQFDPTGERIGDWGRTGSSPGELNGPAGIAFDADDNLFVVDSKNNRVQKFTKDGTFLTTWGSEGKGEGQFHQPWGIVVDAKGNVYIADWGNDRVQKFTPEGVPLLSFGATGSDADAGSLRRPSSVAVDTDGDVYITDWGNDRVQIYSSQGTYLATLLGDARDLSRAGEYVYTRSGGNLDRVHELSKHLAKASTFRRPSGITVDHQGHIIVTDARGRIQIYEKSNASLA